MSIAKFVKTPDEKLDYSIDWGKWLAGDTIASSSWTTTGGLTISSSPAPSATTRIASVWIEGGAVESSYSITNTIVTTAGRTSQRAVDIRVVAQR